MFQWFNCQYFKLFRLEKKWFKVLNFQLNTERPISISGSLSVVGKIIIDASERFEKTLSSSFENHQKLWNYKYNRYNNTNCKDIDTSERFENL